jgi:hypothetical protein
MDLCSDELGVFMNLPQSRSLPEKLGFRSGPGSVHESRTIMTSELSLILDGMPAESDLARYRQSIIDENLLGKATRSTRLKAAAYLANLYGLDPSKAVFRLLRRFWETDQTGRPMLAYLAASARDVLLRDCSDLVLDVTHGQPFDAIEVAQALAERYPARFRPSTLLATAQRLASSWTQAGYLTGKVAKRRTHPTITPQVATYALVLGHLAGLRGKLLLESSWVRLLDRSPAEVMELATEASRQGWLRLKMAGSVIEITFPGLLTPAEERLVHEPD